MVTPSLPGFASWWCEADEGNIESRKARARHRQPESTLSFSLGWLSELRWEAAYKSVGRAATPSQSAGGRHMAGRETGTETDGQKGEDWGKVDGKTRYRACHCLRLCVCVRVCVRRQVSVCFHGKECCGQTKPLQDLIISLPTSWKTNEPFGKNTTKDTRETRQKETQVCVQLVGIQEVVYMLVTVTSQCLAR